MSFEFALPLLVLVLAVTVRVVHLHQSSAHPLFGHPVGAARHFPDMVETSLAAVDPAEHRGVLPAAPLYSRFCSFALEVSGGDRAVIRIVNLVLGVATCLLIYEVARALFSREVGLAAGIGTALYGPLIYFGAELTPAVWIAFLQTLLAWALVRRHAGPGLVSGVAVVSVLVVIEALGWRCLQLPDSPQRFLANLHYLLQGRELLPDLDPYRGTAGITVPLLWDRWLAFPMGLVLPLGVAGLLACRRADDHRLAVRIAILMALTAIVLAAAPDARHRLGLSLMLLPFASSAVMRPRDRSARCLVPAAAFVVLTLAANADVAPPRRLSGNVDHDYWMGVAYEAKEMRAHAIESYDRALTRSPRHPGALLARGRLALADGQADRALRLFQAYLRSHPKSPFALRQIGRSYAALDRFGAVAEAYAAARAAGDSSAGLLADLGIARHLTGDFVAAIDAYRAALQARPDSTAIRYRLARAYASAGMTDRAIEQYRLLASGKAGSETAKARLGELLMLKADGLAESVYLPHNEMTHEAERLLRRLVELGDNPRVRRHLAMLLAKQRRYVEAIEQFERVLDSRSDDYELHLLLGNLHKRVGNEGESRRHFSLYRRIHRGVEMQDVAEAHMLELVEDVFGSQNTR